MHMYVYIAAAAAAAAAATGATGAVHSPERLREIPPKRAVFAASSLRSRLSGMGGSAAAFEEPKNEGLAPAPPPPAAPAAATDAATASANGDTVAPAAAPALHEAAKAEVRRTSPLFFHFLSYL